MARLACPCLNINIFSKTSEWQSNPVRAVKLFPEGCKSVKEDLLYEVNLDVAGVIVELKVLAYGHREGDWIINSCWNCQHHVYITHAVKGDRTFVFPGILSDPKAIHSVCHDKNYSSIFKILLKPIEEDGNVLRRKRVSSMSFGRDDPDMKLVHQQMKNYLKLEEEAMEYRVRSFEERERETFLKLQEKAHRERSLLFAVLAKARENVISEEIRSAHLDADKRSPPKQVAGISVGTEQKKVAKEKTVTEKVMITIQDNSSYSKRSATADSREDSLFTLEGFDEEHASVENTGGNSMRDVAFPQSDDEDSSTNDSSFRDVSTLCGVTLATSVPVTIPLFQRPTALSATTTLDEATFDAGDVGDSIRQLALSVQDTGMFGDLPRPRMMTNPFS